MKDKKISIRISKEDYKQLKNDKRKTYDIFITGLTLEKVEDRKEIIKQIKMIGNNINQIAKKINENKMIHLKDLKEYLIKVNDILKKL